MREGGRELLLTVVSELVEDEVLGELVHLVEQRARLILREVLEAPLEDAAVGRPGDNNRSARCFETRNVTRGTLLTIRKGEC